MKFLLLLLCLCAVATASIYTRHPVKEVGLFPLPPTVTKDVTRRATTTWHCGTRTWTRKATKRTPLPREASGCLCIIWPCACDMRQWQNNGKFKVDVKKELP
ncbi:hypothetical protein PRIPAC_92358 [Pristionchus pacificus]|uniref:Uncharacterized protein n=1 Tax=Pristionchus pacificus TaxID=54126 RepID=A0A2A6BR40_PRIPA|nr:hypothetical protein PRIPAC_92358 [Pristionchus pacificus]|eukprot:PDM68296.1 hypothetical protein PRIPAC_46340 [Pristionchus pacificus]